MEEATTGVGLASGPLTVSVVDDCVGRRLRAFAPSAHLLGDFDGHAAEATDGTVLEGPLSPQNATAVRKHLPWLTPQPLGLVTSAGVGDRLGLATPGHVRAFRQYGGDVAAVFAQQSAREMDRLDRSPQQVLDAATFGCVQAGWDRQVGADADHLKTTEDLDRCLDAGFSLFTLDPGDHVRPTPLNPRRSDLAELPWSALEDDPEAMVRRYSGMVLDLGTRKLRTDESDILRAAAKYGPAVARTVAMYRHLVDRADRPVEVEVAVDETEEPTTVVEHLYMVTEMSRLGVRMVSYAPRYIGGFEKGVDYIGSIDGFADSLAEHAHVAQTLGPYKLSLHSGSDKFSVYGAAVAATGPLVHLKTSGTSYLEALAVAARCSPSLFRDIYRLSRNAYRGARATYHVSARLERTPAPETVPDAALPDLVTASDSRQILHVGYGAVLSERDESGLKRLDEELRSLLHREAERYAERLESHFGRHLQPFSGNA